MPSSTAGSDRSSTISAAKVTLRNTSIARSSGRIGTAIWSTMPPASGFCVISCSVAPVVSSPARMAQFTGARPRYLGRSEPCMLKAPRMALASIAAESMRR